MMKLSECTPLPMPQKMLGTESWIWAPFRVSGPPQKGQNFKIFVFQDRSFKFLQDVDF